MLHSKIHRATVTQADLHYVGSLTIDRDLMDAADLLPGQQVDVVDVDNGNRLTTYAIEGERGSGILCRYQATIIGRAIFMISEGWIRVKPRLSQRVEPLTVTPATSTPISSNTPTM